MTSTLVSVHFAEQRERTRPHGNEIARAQPRLESKTPWERPRRSKLPQDGTTLERARLPSSDTAPQFGLQSWPCIFAALGDHVGSYVPLLLGHAMTLAGSIFPERVENASKLPFLRLARPTGS